MIRAFCLSLLLAASMPAVLAQHGDTGNRLAYLDTPVDPYYVGTDFAKLTTPQWIGEPGVTTAAILSIDDMREPAKYEAFIRPILDRLKQIDGAEGRAPLSIFACEVDPNDAQLQAWLKEGVSIEVHTTRHPCPLLAGGDLAAAKETVDTCIDLLKGIPNMSPVCYRMPCCDSMNSLSPRFFAEIFNQTTPRGSFLQSDSSMFVWFNEKDKDLPKELVAGDRFTKYMPRLRGWVNWIENYPYPYVIGTKCWEFPSVIPSDWEAQNRHGVNNQKTVVDLKAALDACVIKEGLFTFVFHPHGWIKNTQVAELVDHAEKAHGEKVRFLNVREATERITKNMLLGQPLRKPDGSNNGVRVLDLNNDGYMDVVIGNDKMRKTRVWDPDKEIWKDTDSFPVRLDIAHVAFGVVRENGHSSMLVCDPPGELYHFLADGSWEIDPEAVGLASERSRYRDIDGDGVCELVETTGARLIDLDGDGDLDSIVSNADHFEVRLFDSTQKGWSIEGRSGKRGEHDPAEEIPPFTRADGSNNGAWIHGDHFYWQNEDTVTAQSQVDSRSFEFLLEKLPKKVSVLDSKPLSPEEALKTFATSLDFEIDIVAAEPEVMDPIDMAWGIDGKLWVVEMADYPLGLDGKGEPGGRVRWLEDTDGDGRYEKSVLFMDGLQNPTGVMPYGKQGVLILAAPNLIHVSYGAEDGLPIDTTVLYDGFGEGNQQHRANGLRWGLDNWIHIANGDSNGVIRSIKTGEKLDISGRDLRIWPGRGWMQAESGRTQFGRNRDDWGNWFGCNNSNPIWHFVLPDYYLKRNPHVTTPSPTVNLVRSDGLLELFPTSSPLERFNDFHTLNHITSACGAMIYRAHTLPLYGDAFICEPVHNLIVRQVVTPDGYSFVGNRAKEEQRSEFFTSTDPWCRPVSIRTGPDGCLWVADMYRLVIEHPEWIPQEWQEKLDLRSGHDRGRIYRIRPKNHQQEPAFKIDHLSISESAALLGSKNGTVRDLAHQSLTWIEPSSGSSGITGNGQFSHIVPQFEHPNPASRVQALSLLQGLFLTDEVRKRHLVKALDDRHPAVRRHAIKLSEMITTDPPLEKLASLANDPDPQVRLQLAFSLGAFDDAKASAILADLAQRFGADPYFAAAVLSSAIPHLEVLATKLNDYPEELRRQLLVTIAKESDAEKVAAMLAEEVDYELAAVLLESLRSQKKLEPAKFQALIGRARKDVFENAPAAVAAIRLLGITGATEGLEKLLAPELSPEVQAAAVHAIASVPVLLRDWNQHSPALRTTIAGSLSKDPANANAILEYFTKPSGSPRAFLSFLMGHPDEAIRGRAAQLFQQVSATREAIIARYRKVPDHQPDPDKGRAVFQQSCAVCHALDGIGNNVGPDLRALTDRSPEALLTAILDPNRAVEDKFTTYALKLKDASARAGMVGSETSTALVVTLLDGSSESILRADLESIESIGRSLMPEGLEAAIDPQQMQDLIAWISSNRGKPREFPGNQPRTISAADDGSFQLTAAHAEIYGKQIVFEPGYKNIGFWGDRDDHVVWSIDCKQPGRYGVELNYACPADVAGNEFIFSTLSGTVESTGSWDSYAKKFIGEIELASGINRISFRSAGVIQGFLLDLQSLSLTRP